MFKPLKITLTLQGSITNSSRLLHFDGLLAYQAVERAGGDWTAKDHIPLDKAVIAGKSVWKASAIRFYATRPSLLQHSIRRSNAMDFAIAQEKNWFAHSKRGTELVDLENEKRRQLISLDSSRGEFKAYNLYTSTQSVSHAEAYCVGDIDQIRELLSGVTYIGKKRAVGSGKVLNIRIEEDQVAIINWQFRHMPEGMPESDFKYALAIGSLQSPYWSHETNTILEPLEWWR